MVRTQCIMALDYRLLLGVEVEVEIWPNDRVDKGNRPG